MSNYLSRREVQNRLNISKSTCRAKLSKIKADKRKIRKGRCFYLYSEESVEKAFGKQVPTVQKKKRRQGKVVWFSGRLVKAVEKQGRGLKFSLIVQKVVENWLDE